MYVHYSPELQVKQLINRKRKEEELIPIDHDLFYP